MHRPQAPTFFAVAVLVSLATPVSATTLGPDAFGYVATDEVTYTFEDISLNLLTHTKILEDEDDATALAPIGFTFAFYGAARTAVHVSTNGLLAFGASYPWFVNRELDSALLLDDPTIIAPLWHDWVFDNDLQPLADAVYYETLGSPGSRRFVVQWNRAYSDTPTLSDPVTFQVVLYEETGNILFHYADVFAAAAAVDGGGSATVGIRNAGGTASGEFLQWSHDEAVIGDGQTILFAVPEPAAAPLLLAGLAALGGRRRARRA